MWWFSQLHFSNKKQWIRTTFNGLMNSSESNWYPIRKCIIRVAPRKIADNVIVFRLKIILIVFNALPKANIVVKISWKECRCHENIYMNNKECTCHVLNGFAVDNPITAFHLIVIIYVKAFNNIIEAHTHSYNAARHRVCGDILHMDDWIDHCILFRTFAYQ